MGGTGVIDSFLGIFTQYIDSGFGLVQGDVRWLAGTLIAIDITLAGLFWALAPDEDILARLVKKTLFIGVFAFIIGNWNNLAQIIFNSFAGLGLKAGGGTISAGAASAARQDRRRSASMPASRILDRDLRPDGLHQLLREPHPDRHPAARLVIVVLAFFILAIQLFVSLIEFKLTTLAGFVLVPFGLFGHTAFLAERVLGNVVSSGVKVLVLAVIVGIGSTLFGQFTAGFGNPPTISDAMTLVLAALVAARPRHLRARHRQRPRSPAARSSAPAPPSARAWRPAASARPALVSPRAASARPAARSPARRAAAPRVAGGARPPIAPAAPAAVAARPPAARDESAARAAASLRESFAAGGRAVTAARARRRLTACRRRIRPTRIGPARLGAPHEAQPDRSAMASAAAAPRRPLRRQPVGGGRRRSFRRGVTHVQTTDRALRQDARTGDALPARRPGLGRAHRLRPRPGQELAARLLRRAGSRAAALPAGLVWQSARGTITPWVVQVDQLGQAQAVAPATADYQPTDPQIAWHLARFIEEVRGIPADPVVLRQNWLDAYDYVTDKGALALNDYARTNDPFSKIGKMQVSVEVSSVIRASDDSFRVAWIERRYVDDALASTERWSAILTVVVQTPTDADRLKKNPLGVYVHALNWSKELG